MTTPPLTTPWYVRVLRWGALAALVVAVLPFPAYWAIDATTGVTGWDMNSVDQEILDSFADAEALNEFLESIGAAEDPVSEQLSYLGEPGAFTGADDAKMTRFVFVAEDRVVETPLGTLIVFDRTKEELLQSQSLRNIAILVTVGGGVAVLILGLASVVLGRRRGDSATA